MRNILTFLLMILVSFNAEAATNATSSQNVGIGTSSPEQKLVVRGGNAVITGSVTAGSFSGDGSALTGISGGSIGIGTANTVTYWPTTTTIGSLPTSTYPSLTELSYVKGATSSLQTQINGLSSGSGGWTDGGTNVFTTDTTDNVGIGTTTPSTTLEIVKQSSKIPFMVSATATGDGNYLIITSAGNVGVGTTIPLQYVSFRAAATNIFSATNTSSSGSGAGAGIQAHSDDNAAVIQGDRLGFYTFGGSADTGDTINNGAAITGFADGTFSSTSAPTEIRFETAPSGSTTRSTRMYVKSDGNIGIGTANPQTTLQALGDTKIGNGTFSNTSSNEDLYVEGNLEVDGSLFGSGTGPMTITNANVGIGTVTAGSLLTVGSTGQFTVDTSGNTRVGIGTTTAGTLVCVKSISSSTAVLGYCTGSLTNSICGTCN